MSLFSFAKTIKKDSYSLVFTIESGSVTGGIIKFTEKPGVEVLYYFKENLVLPKEISTTKHLAALKTGLKSLSLKLRQKGLKIENAFYIFSSPWSISQTRTIRVKESKAFKLGETYLKNFIEQHEKNSQKEAEKNKVFTDISAHGKIIDKKIIQIKANGYTIENFNHKLVKEAEVSVFSTVIPQEVLEATEDAVSQSFLIKNVYCHSVSLATFSVIRDLFSNQEDFICLDIDDEMTDIIIVKDGLISSEVSFPFGRNAFVRQLAEKFKVSEAIADSMIKMHQQKSNDELAALKFTVAMNNITRDWFTKVNEIFAQFTENLYTPQKLFVVANSDISSILIEKLKEVNPNVVSVEARKINSPVKIDDTIFKINLMFLDKVYKI